MLHLNGRKVRIYGEEKEKNEIGEWKKRAWGERDEGKNDLFLSY